ncbi:MAG: hypothetical protein MAG453_01033 [Calditrichaeota bacterium]|nr:hypothetical protein [Calditrichota bacterium]
MWNRLRTGILLAGVLLTVPALSFAYVGPGAGVTLLGALWAVIVAVFMVIAGVVLWPVRSLLRKRRAANRTRENSAEDAKTQASKS